MPTQHRRQRWRNERDAALGLGAQHGAPKPVPCHDPPPDDGSLDAATGIVRTLLWMLALYAAGITAWLVVTRGAP